MKKFALLMILASATSASAAEVVSGFYSPAQDAIVLDVSYGGGCEKHVFTLEVGACAETSPVQCGVKVVDQTTNDFCDAYVTETVVFPLSNYGLNDVYYNGAYLSIRGDSNSQVHLQLPLKQ